MRIAFCVSAAWIACSFVFADESNEGETVEAAENTAGVHASSAELTPVPWSIVGDWLVTNPDWNFAPNNSDVLTLHEDGTHSVAHGSTGRWILTAEKGTPVLVLRWDRFGTESMSMIALDHFRGQKRPNRFIEMRRVIEE